MIERIVAYLLLAFFFLIDFIIRKGKTAKSIEHTKDDKLSTMFIGFTFFIVLVLSMVLNFFSLGKFDNTTLAWIAVTIMITGLVIRIHSMLTLRNYYTRTLITVEKQKMVKKGLYKIIRHPGYLGTILIWSAAGLAMENKIIFTVATILILLAYYYRINNEEKMLFQNFGEEYADYKKHSWRLIPIVWRSRQSIEKQQPINTII
jgi:protein-S-isoprenylcysteine O-methyltransferase Ste14